MKCVALSSLYFAVWMSLSAQNYALRPPILSETPLFLDRAVSLSMSFHMEGTQIRYTLDGSEPTLRSALYRRPIRLQPRTQILKAKTFHPDFLPSETVERSFYQQGISIKDIRLSPEPSASYRGKGATTLINQFGGEARFQHPSWLGFEKAKEVVLELDLDNKQTVREIWLEVRNEQSAWLFLPEKIEVFAENRLLKSEVIQGVSEKSANASRMFKVAFPPIQTQQLRVVVHPLQQIPSWHGGKGTVAWLFISEVAVR